MNQEAKAVHWADITAQRIIGQHGDKDLYTLASGITPSGTVHFGNFRETITVDLVARALREKGKKVRFIFSWDDYDTFRKIPKNLPKQEVLEQYLFQPIVDTPDPYDTQESYAAYQEHAYEAQLKKVGVNAEPIYQSKKYRAGDYKEGIKTALKKRDVIVNILNAHRSEPLADSWQPVSIYCANCNTDNQIQNVKYDGDATLAYSCGKCNYVGSEDLNTTSRVKLPWRMDWPMRWAYEQVDFEPGGKDHSSQGGSYTTAKEIVKQVYNFDPPIYLQYDFVSIKGAGGKMSSSSGNVITVNDVLNIYEPEMIRWTFASYKTNVDFSVSFDLDVIKTYEDFDRQERWAYGKEEANEKKVAMAKRVMELSQLDGKLPAEMPFQPAFRHLCNVLQINDGDISKARAFYDSDIKTERDERRFNERSACAWYWVENYAPDEFKFRLNKEKPTLDLSDSDKAFLSDLTQYLESDWENIESDRALHEKMYEFIHTHDITPQEAFTKTYQLLISREKGPKLAGFIRTIGKEKVLNLLK